MKNVLGVFLVFAVVVGPSRGAPDGGVLFTQNCAACHQLDRQLVGPSLVEISKLYLGRPEEFLAWCVAPRKKRDSAIEMPSMAHLGRPALLAIHQHILKIARGVKEVKADTKDRYEDAPSLVMRPLVQRMFLPDCGPAAIAVALDDRVSLCWDAGTCRLRYVWTGGFLNAYGYWEGNGSQQAKLQGEVCYREPRMMAGLEGEVKFKGYDLREGLPVFRYSIGGVEVEEGYVPLSGRKGFSRHFVVGGETPRGLVFEVPAGDRVRVICEEGEWKNEVLTLRKDAAREFTMIFELP